MCGFPVFAKKLFLFAVIFALLAGNMCFSEEITLTAVMSIPPRIIQGTLPSGAGETIFGDGFEAIEGPAGEYVITFLPVPITLVPAFSAPPTVVCTYMPPPKTGPKAQVVSVSAANATLATVVLDDIDDVNSPMQRVSTGSISFIAIGPR